MKKKNIDPFLEAIANTTAPLVEFNDKIKDIVKDYMNQSCVMESINALDTSVKKGLEKADAMYKPESVRANADLVLKDYNKVIADEVEKQTKILHAYVIAHNINLTCYLEVFREGFRNVTYLFDNVIPDYLVTNSIHQ